MKSSDRILIYVSKKQLKQLLQDPMFVAYAPLPGNKTTGGRYTETSTFFQLKKGADE